MMQNPLIIGVFGGSGSGKTTFVESLKASFPARTLCLISHDEYYKPIDKQPVDENGVVNFDLPECYDNASFVNDLVKLKAGHSITMQKYLFNNPNLEPSLITFHPAPILVIEGLFIMHEPGIKDLLDIKIFVETKLHLKMARRINRDRKERNYPLEDVLYRFEHHVIPAFEQYIAPYITEADVIVQNNQNMQQGLRIMEGFLKDYLGKKFGGL